MSHYLTLTLSSLPFGCWIQEVIYCSWLWSVGLYNLSLCAVILILLKVSCTLHPLTLSERSVVWQLTLLDVDPKRIQQLSFMHLCQFYAFKKKNLESERKKLKSPFVHCCKIWKGKQTKGKQAFVWVLSPTGLPGSVAMSWHLILKIVFNIFSTYNISNQCFLQMISAMFRSILFL